MIYADDTLIVAEGRANTCAYMQPNADKGANYGLKYNWRKLEVLPKRCRASIEKPDKGFW